MPTKCCCRLQHHVRTVQFQEGLSAEDTSKMETCVRQCFSASRRRCMIEISHLSRAMLRDVRQAEAHRLQVLNQGFFSRHLSFLAVAPHL
jgi:hypothetical protein